MNWKSVGVVIEGESLLISGLNVWDYKWVSLKEPLINLPHPSYSDQLHGFHLYQIEHGEHKVHFAASELSPNVFGFYVMKG